MLEDLQEKQRKILKKRGIESELDLQNLCPYKFYDFSKTVPMSIAYAGDYVAVSGTLISAVKDQAPGKRSMIKIKIMARTDMGEELLRVNIIGQLFMFDYYFGLTERVVYCLGKLEYDPRWGYSMFNPMALSDNPAVLYWHKVYPKYSGIGEETLKKLILSALSQVEETLPDYVIKKLGVMKKKEALQSLNYAKDLKQIQRAIQRNVLEDQLYFACKLEREKRKLSPGTEYNLKSMVSVKKIVDSLPYELTKDQKGVIDALLKKMREGRRVTSLIQGDVGCGKSIVAFLLMLAMADSGYQSIMMAPTLILANQHYEELSSYAKKCGFQIAFIGGKQKVSEKRQILKDIKEGNVSLVVGTHAAISEKVEFKNLALAVIDEEHRFGVKQREALIGKSNGRGHIVYFSATPIPRTTAATLYGDADVFQIKTLPAGRKPIQTAICHTDQAIFKFAKPHLENGEQMYIVCPLVDSDEEDCKIYRNTKEVAKTYQSQLGVEVGIVTGKQSKKSVEETLERFKNGDLRILVATTVIEVGVNVPNATIIVVTDAWAFGLAQLHQLRGRVGRGKKQGYCVLQSDKESERLSVLCNTTDGFVVAEEDLRLRGAGNIIGEEQSGQNRFLTAAVSFPNMFQTVKRVASEMVDRGTDRPLIEKMEKRSEKIYVDFRKIKIFSIPD